MSEHSLYIAFLAALGLAILMVWIWRLSSKRVEWLGSGSFTMAWVSYLLSIAWVSDHRHPSTWNLVQLVVVFLLLSWGSRVYLNGRAKRIAQRRRGINV